MAQKSTWRPHDTHGKLTAAREQELPESAFAFPAQRKMPLTGPGYVREALARFGEVDDASDDERDLAFDNIKKAAAHYRVEMTETDWRQLSTRKNTQEYRRGNRF